MNNPIKIHIPLTPCFLYIYHGKKGFNSFLKYCQKNNPSWTFADDVEGYQYKESIWLRSFPCSLDVVFHEVQHFLDWLFKYLACENEIEFKAYLMSYIVRAVFLKIGRKIKS